MASDSERNPSTILRNELPWWTWALPGLVCRLASEVDALTRLGNGLSLVHWSLALGLIMAVWWGPRVLPAVFLSALSAAPGSTPELRLIFALPETAAAAAAALLSRPAAGGASRRSNLAGLQRFILTVLLPAVLVHAFASGWAMVTEDPARNRIAWNLVHFVFVTDALDVLSVSLTFITCLSPFMEARGWSRVKNSPRHRLPAELSRDPRLSLSVAAGILAMAAMSLLLPAPRFSFLAGIFAVWAAARLGYFAAGLACLLAGLAAVLAPMLMRPQLAPLWMADTALPSLYGLLLLYGSAQVIGGSVSDAREENDRRRAAERVVKAGERHFRAIMENIQEGLGTLDVEGKISFVNARFCELFGYQAGELLDRPMLEILDEANRAAWRENFSQPRRKLASSYEMEITRPDGRRVQMLVAASPLVDEFDKFAGVVGVFTDITRLKLEEARLKARFELSRKAMGMDERQIIQSGLEAAVRLTGSEVGYLHFFDPDIETVQTAAWSAGALEQCGAEAESHWPLSQAGVWADPVRINGPVIHNDFENLAGRKGYPEGHVRVKRHCSVPVYEDGRARAILGVGNKAAPYDDQDTRMLELLGEDIWTVVGRRRTEENLKASLREKEILIQEVHHRVKNNLALINAFLNLESSLSVGKHTPEEMFRESQNRIRSMAMVHEKLYLSGNLSRIQASDYLTSLVREITRSYRSPARVELDFDRIELGIDALIPCGLIVNELVTNAVKHAFAGVDEPVLRVSFKREGSSAGSPPWTRLAVEDNGPGLPEGLLATEPDSMGLKIVFLLAKQLRGELSSELKDRAGTRVLVRFLAAEA